MKNKTLKTNLFVIFSFAFFLFASAFTLMPESSEADIMISGCSSECCTCDSDDLTQCADATFCGMDGYCWSGDEVCRRGGDLCGECDGDGES